MMSIGEALREERLKRNLDLREISRELKIPAKFLEAIEREQFDKLPAAVFAKSFARQYARYLGLHEEELADAVQHMLEPPQLLSERAPERPSTPAIQLDPMAEWERVGERRSWSSSLPALAMVVVVMLGCSGVYAWWQRSRRAMASSEQAPAASQTAQAQTPSTPPAAPTGAVAAAPDPAPPPTSNAVPAAADRASIEPVSTAPAESMAMNAKPEQPVSVAPPEGGTNPAAASTPLKTPGAVHVEITASDVVWVLAKADGKTSYIGTLEPHQSRVIDADGAVTIRLGNAGGAQITLNGKPIGDVGPRGQSRTVQLTSGGFQIVAPPKPDLLFDPLR